jgi:hypothetical protein
VQVRKREKTFLRVCDTHSAARERREGKGRDGGTQMK